MAAASVSCSAQHVGREESGVRVGRDDQYFGRACNEVDPGFACQKLLRSGHIDVARPDDTVRAGNGLRAVGEGCDGLRLHLKYLMNAEHGGGSEDLIHGFGAGGADIRNTRDESRHGGHDYGGRERVAAGGNVGSDGIERPHNLSQL